MLLQSRLETKVDIRNLDMKQTGTARKGRFDVLPSKPENEVICKSEIAVLS